MMGIQMEFGNGMALFARDKLVLRQKIPVSKTLAFEVRTCFMWFIQMNDLQGEYVDKQMN